MANSIETDQVRYFVARDDETPETVVTAYGGFEYGYVEVRNVRRVIRGYVRDGKTVRLVKVRRRQTLDIEVID